MIVKFVRHIAPYNAGERAEFADDIAHRMIEAGEAVHDQPAVVDPLAEVVQTKEPAPPRRRR